MSLKLAEVSSSRSWTRSRTRSVSRLVPSRATWLDRREMFAVREKRRSERSVVKELNSGSSWYSGSSERRHVVGWARKVLEWARKWVVSRAVSCLRDWASLGTTWLSMSMSMMIGIATVVGAWDGQQVGTRNAERVDRVTSGMETGWSLLGGFSFVFCLARAPVNKPALCWRATINRVQLMNPPAPVKAAPLARPYRDFLTPSLHRRFTSAALVGLAACWLISVPLASPGLFWSWFPLGPAGVRTLFLFISSLSIFVLRVAQLHFGPRTSISTFESFWNYLVSKNTILTCFWYSLSAFLFAELYISLLALTLADPTNVPS
jgi:hypothetical protein